MYPNESKIIFMILTARKDALEDIKAMISDEVGGIDFIGKWHAFDHTNYYEREMGAPLHRTIISTEALREWEEIWKLKPLSASWEDKFRVDGNRTINIDAGLIDYYKLVLLTGKDGGYKIPIGENVWADITLWHDKEWKPLPWTFPDIRTGMFNDELSEIRKIYKKQMKVVLQNG